jgi:hypothetical protein
VRIDCALLCDAATVREGLLHILGGGVTRATRESFPAPLAMTLALRIMIHPTEAARPHELTMVLQAEDGERVVEMSVEFGLNEPGAIAAGEEVSLPIPIPMPDLPLPQAGSYSFELLIDGIHQATVPFKVVEGETTPASGSEEPA